MARPPRWTMLSAICGLAMACAEGEPMPTAGEDMSRALQDARAENDRHAVACEDVLSTLDMEDELSRHERAMDGLTSRMETARSGMMRGPMMHGSGCSGSGFEHLSGSVADTRGMMAEHVDRMHDAETLALAQSECSRHTDQMREMMNGMMTDLDSMPCMAR
jgi:hypothetical protein